MLAQEVLDDLRLKILPEGGDRILCLLARYREHVNLITVAMDHVPLIIVARHSLLARLPVAGTIQKLSQAPQIIEAAESFLAEQDTLYLYLHLPMAAAPSLVLDLLEEVTNRVQRRAILRERIDYALDHLDRNEFTRLVTELHQLQDMEKGVAI